MIAIINYGLSNLLSIKRAVDLYSNEAVITDRPEDLKRAEKIILPGVGAFQYGMDCLTKLHLQEIIMEMAKEGVPIMGICLGMQMLFEESDEGGLYRGLGLIPGRVEKISDIDINGYKQNVPHIGWEKLARNKEFSYRDSILKNIPINQEFYFVHSYEGKPRLQQYCMASIGYGGRDICAIVQDHNVLGCQFHPEKSGVAGLELIKNFVLDF